MKLNETAVQVMKEIGIDISKQESKGLDALPYKEFDILVTMRCGDKCPFIPAKEGIQWKIPDPKVEPFEFIREVRDEIKDKVLKLIEEIQYVIRTQAPQVLMLPLTLQPDPPEGQ